MGQQYLDNGGVGIAITLILVAFILLNISRAKGGKELFIRRIPGLNSVEEAVGRAAELGKPVMMVPGLSDPLNAKAMQAINIFAHITRLALRFANPILVCCGTAPIYTVSQEIIRDVYQQEGAADKYDVDSVRFISDRQFAFAAGVSGLIIREQAAACFFLGEYYAESLILAETANSVGAIQVASSTELTQTPFFIAACDYVLIGDEFYAAGAYLTRQPVLVGSLIGQDWCKLLIMSFIVLGVIANSVQMQGMESQSWNEGKFEPLPASKHVAKGDTSVSRWLNPDPDKHIKIDRQKLPPEDLPSAPIGGPQ